MAAPLCTTLKELGHNQAKPTPITTNNITAQGLTMGTMTAKASTSMDQRFHWLKCRDAQCESWEFQLSNGIGVWGLWTESSNSLSAMDRRDRPLKN